MALCVFNVWRMFQSVFARSFGVQCSYYLLISLSHTTTHLIKFPGSYERILCRKYTKSVAYLFEAGIIFKSSGAWDSCDFSMDLSLLRLCKVYSICVALLHVRISDSPNSHLYTTHGYTTQSCYTPDLICDNV